jgi:hypothetical protein
MKKLYLAVVAVLVIALAAGVFVWQKQQESKQVVQEQAKQEDAAKTDVSTDINTSDWKTYRNEKYGYSIKYPSTWFVEETDAANKDPYLRGEDKIGGDLLISNYQTPSKYTLEDVPADIFSLFLMVYRVDPLITYDGFIGQRNYDFDSGIGDRKIEISLGGIKAVQLRMKTTDHPVGRDVVATFVHRGDRMFVLNYSGDKKSLDKMGVAEKVIGSFLLEN